MKIFAKVFHRYRKSQFDEEKWKVDENNEIYSQNMKLSVMLVSFSPGE